MQNLSLHNLLIKREIGDIINNFNIYTYNNYNLLRRFKLDCELFEHHGCVNTVNFNNNGTLLVSGSDDTYLHIYDINTRYLLNIYETLHQANIFCAKFINDDLIISCSADGCVQMCDVNSCQSTLFSNNLLRVKKLAITSNYEFLSCDEEGSIHQFDIRTPNSQLNKIYHNNNFGLSSIDVNTNDTNFFVTGGESSECLIFDRRCTNQPYTIINPYLNQQQNVHITGVAFNSSNGNEVLASYSGNSTIILGDCKTSEILQSYTGHKNIRTVKSVNFFTPSFNIVMSGSDNGCIYFWEKKSGEIVMILDKADEYIVNCIVGHPFEPLLCSSGIDNSPKLWSPISSIAITPQHVCNIAAETEENSPPFGSIMLTPELLMQLMGLTNRQDILDFFDIDVIDDNDDDDNEN